MDQTEKLSRADFDALSLPAQAHFVRGGGVVVADPVSKPPVYPIISTAALMAMTRDAQMEFLRAGGRTET